MPNIPNLQPDPVLPQYRWNAKTRQYIDQRGRFVGRAVIRQQLDRAIDRSADRMVGLAQQLRDGAITLADWQVSMMKEIKAVNIAGALLERGGWFQMTTADFGRVGRIIRGEYEFLRNFAQQLASGKQKPDGTVIRRARAYAGAARSTYYRFVQNAWAAKGFDLERSILTPADHCDDCVAEDKRGYQPIGEVTPVGSRQCLTNCRCRMGYKSSATGEEVIV